MKPANRAPVFFPLGVIVIHAIFYALALHYTRFFNGDSFEYIQEAYNIKQHFFFYSGNPALGISEEYMTLRTPGYPLFLSVIYSIGAGNKIVLLLQNLISIFNILNARKTLCLLGYEKKYDGLLLVFVAAFPSQFIYANTVAPDILLQTFTLIYFHQAIIFLKSRSAVSAFKMSVALIIGLFVKPVLYPFALIHFLMLLFFVVKNRNQTKSFLLAAFIPLLSIALYSGWNSARTGKFHFTSIQSFNALYYYHQFYSAKNGAEKAGKFLEHERRRVGEKKSFAERYDAAHERGVALLADEPVAYFSFHLKKSFLFFFETGKGEMDLFTGRTTLGNLYAAEATSFRDVLQHGSFKDVIEYARSYPAFYLALMVFVFKGVKFLGLIAFAFYVRCEKIIKWFVFLFLAYFALITGPISNAHYVLPVSLIISGCALTGFAVFLQRRKKRRIITQ